MSEELLKHQVPDREYPPELLATIAASLARGCGIDDCELAVAGALRLLDTTYRILKRHAMDRAASADRSELIPWEKAVMLITGADRPSKAEARLVERLLQDEFEYVHYEELTQTSGSMVPPGHDPAAALRPRCVILVNPNSTWPLLL